MAMFTDANNGKALDKGQVTLKLQAPDKTKPVVNMKEMNNRFVANVSMPAAGKYEIVCKFKLQDGRNVRLNSSTPSNATASQGICLKFPVMLPLNRMSTHE